jgi:D-alanyl-D-alanine carboxypeptidase
MSSDWPHDDTAALIAFYGDPRRDGFVEHNLVYIVPPWKMVLSWDPAHAVPRFLFHRRCKDALDRVFAAIWKCYGESQQRVEDIDLHLWGGAYNYRPIRGSSRLSCHAFGAAIDLAPEQNPMGHSRGHMPPDVIAAFKAEGAYWGGDFHTRLDPMHFQFAHE